MDYKSLLGFCFLAIIAEQILCAPLITSEKTISDATTDTIGDTNVDTTIDTTNETTTEDSVTTAPSIDNNDEDVATKYLKRYGYSKPGFSKNSFGYRDELKNSIKRMQRFFKLHETGDLDNDTIVIMTSPRCSFPDVTTGADGRSKRYVVYSRWDKKTLTYMANNYPASTSGFNSRDEIDAAFADAYQKWAEVSDLTFTKSTTGNADLKSTFYYGDHGDGDPFDGKGGILAHAFFPRVGQIHFDNAETWSKTYNGFNLNIVAIHEYGHALGLGHTNNRNAIMYPNYQYSTNPKLGIDDIAGIQSIYGLSKKHGVSVATTPKPTTTTTRRRYWVSFWNWFWLG